MSRPLRLEFPGAVYHVTARGDRREPIYVDAHDRQAQIEILAQVCERFDAQVLAYCQMGNHFHLVLYTRQGNLSRLMRHLNGVYTQRFNRRHAQVGHLFQGRFKAILVDRDAYLLTLCRYVERNPVAAGLVATPGEWPWSSCRAHLGLVATPPWLDSAGLHGHLLGHAVQTDIDQRKAEALYAELVGQPVAEGFWTQGLRQQIFLGDADFVDRELARVATPRKQAREVPRVQRTSSVNARSGEGETTPMSSLRGRARQQALWLAYTQRGATMTALALEAGLSISRVSRLLSEYQREAKGKT